jgi:hypothetical protein
MEFYMIRKQLIVGGLILAGSLSVAQADHNSVMGPGTANMPNDIHNMRIEDMDDEDASFSDLVSRGIGADTVNRYADDDATMAATDAGQGSGSGAGAGGGGGAGGGNGNGNGR